MDESAGRAYFERLLARVLRRGLPPAVHRTEDTGPLPGMVHAEPPHAPRLSVCLKGVPRYFIRRDGKLSDVRPRPGEANFIAPDCCVEPDSKRRYESLAIVFQPAYTRFAHIIHNGDGRTPRAKHVCHVAGARDDDARFLCHSLAKMPRADPHDRPVRMKLELLLHSALAALRISSSPPEGKAHLAWQAACEFVREHCHEPLSRDDVAAFLDKHPNHISRLFAMFSRQSFNAFVTQARLARSRQLLRDPKLTIKEVAKRCGFTSANYFIRVHRRQFGKTPSKARRG